jgi:hypothetical protein
MYAVLRRIQVQPHFVEDSIQRIKLGLLPMLDPRPERVEQQTLAQRVQVLGQESIGKTHGFTVSRSSDRSATASLV